MTCSVEGCDQPVSRRWKGWCEKHFSRWRRHGTTDSHARVKKPCAVEDCPNMAGTGGYCGKHWERIKRHGDPHTEVLIWGDPERRFWSKVDKTDTCWLWTGSLTYDGYAIFGVASERTGAHRCAWRFTNGDIPEGMHLDHLCRVRHCVNPAHLEVVTVAENNRRSAEARRIG